MQKPDSTLETHDGRAHCTAIRLRGVRRFFNTVIPEAGRAEAGIWKK